MKDTLFHCTPEQRERTLKALGEVLATRSEVVFAYAYGSFLENRPFHDVDVGIYVTPEVEEKASLLSLDLAIYLESALRRLFGERGPQRTTSEGMVGECPRPGRFPVDVRVLNGAPMSFCYHVLRGRLLFSRDEPVRVRWAERVISRYLDLKPLRHKALKEAMATWS